jgi:glycosyltransferase involved in cell wall biosynthesis
MPGPLRILMLSRSYPSDVFPNAGLWVERPTVLLDERDGYEVRVVSPQPYCPPLPPLGPLHQYARFRRIAKREVRNGVEIIRPRFAAGPGHTASAFESRAYAHAIGRALDRLGSRFPFDLIHAHFIYPEGAAARDLGRRYGVPFVITEHAPWTQERFSKRVVRNESLAAGRAASGIMAVSTYVRKTIEAWLGDTVPVAFVPTGVDGELFTPAPPRSFVEDRILFVGWPNFNKGVDVLLDAMKLIDERGQPGHLELVGGSDYRGTRLDEQRLKAYRDSLMLGDRVAFVGPRPPAEVARLMARAAVVVLPSRSEASGTVLVEAMACGTPVVATRCGGPEDYVTPDVGRLVPVNDHVALADALVEVLRERARFDPEGLRRYALERFAWPRIVDAWLRAYDRALGNEARSASPDETAVGGSR